MKYYEPDHRTLDAARPLAARRDPGDLPFARPGPRRVRGCIAPGALLLRFPNEQTRRHTLALELARSTGSLALYSRC
jgi:hypothetical protein